MDTIIELSTVINKLAEAYMTGAAITSSEVFFPYNLSFFLIGLISFFVFGAKEYFVYTIRLIIKIIRIAFTNMGVLKREPIGTISLVLAMVLGFHQIYVAFKQDKIYLELQCKGSNDFKTDRSGYHKYLLISATCKLFNTGSRSVSVDSVEPTLYFSKNITLDRDSSDLSFHSYSGDTAPTSLKFPRKITSGDQVNFNTYFAIPIVWRNIEYDKQQPDLESRLDLFETCIRDPNAQSCFYDLTSKYLPNYLYETIEYINNGRGGYQPINGVGVKVTYFNQELHDEIDLFTNYWPFSPNEDVPILSSEYSTYFENLDSPWYMDQYFVKTGIRLNFLNATVIYIIVFLSVFGNLWLVRYFISLLKRTRY